jgi:hypothetical protein
VGMNPNDAAAALASNAQQRTQTSAPIASWRSPALWAGVGVLGLFAWLVYWSLTNRGDANWDRIVYVFGSVEALAFAAAGAIFGTQVQKQQTQQAQQQANSERTRADNAQATAQAHATRAARAEGLATAVVAAAQAEAGASATRVADPGAGTPHIQPSALQQLAALAGSVLPDA